MVNSGYKRSYLNIKHINTIPPEFSHISGPMLRNWVQNKVSVVPGLNKSVLIKSLNFFFSIIIREVYSEQSLVENQQVIVC